MGPARRLRIGETKGNHYSTTHGRERGSVRDVLTTGLAEFTHDALATMHWSGLRFRDYVFLKYRVKLVGWPEDIEFTNMSNLRDMPTEKVRTLLAYWEAGWMFWAAATDGELLAARESVYNALPGPLFPNPEAPRGQRCDVGRHRARPVTNPGWMWGQRFERNGPKSGREVADEWLWDEAVSAGLGAAGTDATEEIEDTDEWDREAWRTRRLPSGEIADDLIESF
ncbi:uncharacterized protein TRAVEDRAFT_46039 [Trametes versicolor FP-101664 SS1]|uniref:uncharacterized protein n=1 Tax=Trametes versicolor (strain FP-101664) TaxID=717944 RepID=UPI00046236A0|nr:uncharacterized protein TRAVEDRAFT_46039 [Trametes versicolor FP-101664 SS1]EIW60798.1 hypothetical protein TRAVEDRAFT_46039 [Trametes versicolor FP-101664 SS1]